MRSLAEDGVSGISSFFQSLENLLTGQEPALHKKSLFGMSEIQMYGTEGNNLELNVEPFPIGTFPIS